MRCTRFGKRSIIARHRGHAFFSSSGRDYASNETNAVEQLTWLVTLIEKRRQALQSADRWPSDRATVRTGETTSSTHTIASPYVDAPHIKLCR